ncbi:MAG: YicC family protein [Flavobacteriaceae bacterium]|jgi:uncharacterized protein (TIGR00255 family)|nr:YicC family protein [Flavobacteriaceae bacterium]
MLQSMTGYGKAEINTGNLKISVETKALNSKTLDMFTRIAPRYKSKELEIRKLINDKLLRGKVDFSITIENLGDKPTATRINAGLVKNYVAELENLDIEGTKLDFLNMAVRMPEIFGTQDEKIDGQEYNDLISCIHSSLDCVIEFRKEEGKSLETLLKEYIVNILNSLSKIEPYEPERLRDIKGKLQTQLAELQIQHDDQRFHQEMIYYIEKLDISEEKNRLKQHCKYFFEVMENEAQSGKKLGFIAQEMGREINTIGSKANHSEIQKLVVLMKDELEKIKEQTNNVF